MFFDKLNSRFNGTFFVWTHGETKKCSVDLLTIFGDVDARTRCWHTFDTDKNVHGLRRVSSSSSVHRLGRTTVVSQREQRAPETSRSCTSREVHCLQQHVLG